MKDSNNYKFKVPEFGDPADIRVVGESIEAIDEKIHDREVEQKKHREAEVIDHPDGSVTLAKLADDVLNAMLRAEYDADHKRLILTGGAGSGGGGGSASLPIATADVLGGIKIGAGIDMDDDGTANVKPDVRADEIMTAEEAAEIINRVFSEEGLL